MQKLRDHITELAKRPEQKADTIEVQHLLVSFKDRGVDKATRSMEEAEELAAELYERVLKGEDFAALIKKYTDDSPPGIYGMTMTGPGDRRANIYARKGMVPAFGNVGWKLKVGEIGVAGFDENDSPYGWHIIKRTK